MPPSPSDETITPRGQPAPGRLTPAALEAALRQVEPGARLVSARVLRRVIKHFYRLPALAWKVPHAQVLLIPTPALLSILEPIDLGAGSAADLPETIVLLRRPSAIQFQTLPQGELLTGCWRLLFHAHIHRELTARMTSGHWTAAELRRRIRRLGPVVFEEIRSVLAQEHWLLPPGDEVTAYIEAVAVLLELYYFDRRLLGRYFPGLVDVEGAVAILSEDCDPPALLAASCPTGASPPLPSPDFQPGLPDVPWDVDEAAEEPPRSAAAERVYGRLMARAESAAAAGNVVRSALLRARALGLASRRLKGKTRSALRGDVERLVGWLRAALELDDAAAWESPLTALAVQSAGRTWSAEARLLYDLQKACLAAQRETYAVDLVEWALSWGRRPIKRPLPNQRDVLVLKYLRAAQARLAAARLAEEPRLRLLRLMKQAQQGVEERMDRRLRPMIEGVLDEVGLRAANLPERVARAKLVGQLSDRIAQRGFLTMPDVRDALSRNNLKLADVAQLGDVVRGDPLLQADRRLALSLDGVYHRGEFYLRWLQQLSALAFGTPAGRFVVRYVALPFGGAYLVLAFIDHFVELLAHTNVDIDTPPVRVVMGVLILGLLYWPAFRSLVLQTLKTVWRLVRGLLFDLPRRLLQLPLVQHVLYSRWFTLLMRWGVKPAVLTALAWWLLPESATSWKYSPTTLAVCFSAVELLLNSRLGRSVEQIVTDWAVQAWRRFGLWVVTGLLSLLIDVFKGALQGTERLLNAVDEWLQFHAGQGRAMLALKAVLGAAWFFVAYIVRFCVNLLVEPQINPIKHFPVVSVSHKLMLPFIPPFARLLASTIEPRLALTLATLIIASTPGMFGFLVWELKENWRLFAANRPLRLVPLPIGSHGETLARLLKPGFHSGTIPKRFAKLRRAVLVARRKQTWKAVRKHVQVLENLQRDLRHFIERDFLEFFRQTPEWRGAAATAGPFFMATNRVHVEIELDQAAPGPPLVLEFAVRGGWLTADVRCAAGLDRLDPSSQAILVNALTGLLKAAGTELLRPQWSAPLAAVAADCDVDAQGLVGWIDPGLENEFGYDLDGGPLLLPRMHDGFAARQLPVLRRGDVVFAETPVTWESWLAAWEQLGPASPEIMAMLLRGVGKAG